MPWAVREGEPGEVVVRTTRIAAFLLGGVVLEGGASSVGLAVEGLAVDAAAAGKGGDVAVAAVEDSGGTGQALRGR